MAAHSNLTKKEIVNLTVTQAQQALSSGCLTSVKYLETLIEHIKTLEQKNSTKGINGIIFFNFKQALKEARKADQTRIKKECVKGKPLAGIPLLVKDSFDVAGIPTTAATPSLRTNLPSSDGPVIARLRRAGAIVIAKTNLTEMSLGLTVPNETFAGPCRNPYSLEFTSGGSSGGSAAGLAARYAPMALGEDTGGSIRCPAMCCGIIGFRPTTKRYSQAGIVPVGASFDTAGPMARSVEDIQLLDGIITGQNEAQALKARKLRIGIPSKFFYQDLTPEVEEAVKKVLAKLRRAGITLIDKEIDLDFTSNSTDQLAILTREFESDLNKYLAPQIKDPNNSLRPISAKEVVTDMGTPAIKAFADALLVPAPSIEYLDALKRRREQQRVFKRYFKDNKLDAILVPSSTHVAVPLTVPAAEAFGIYVRNFSVAAFSSVPAINLPVGLSNGLPVGIELMGRAGRDRRLLDVARTVERVIQFKATPL